MKLNLGCGKDIRKGWINLDVVKSPGVDKVHDLNQYPYPFKDNSFDEIVAYQVMEHLDYPSKFIQEIWRISKQNAKIIIDVPHFSSDGAWTDITHVRPFSLVSMRDYDIDYGGAITLLNADKKVKFKVKVEAQVCRPYRWIGLNKLAQKYPRFYEKFLAYIFQIAGVRYNLIAIKK